MERTTNIYNSIEQSRPKTDKQIVSIQYLRGLAALAVVAAHAGGLGYRGQAGVDVFFVISGFIMWTITSGTPSIPSFLKNRIIRIVPLYWIATILMGLHQKAPWTAIAKSMFFTPFIGEKGEIWPVLVQGWTLNYEMFFYVLVSASLFAKKEIRIILLLLLIVILSSIGMIWKFSDPILFTYTNPLLLEFSFGIVLAEFRFRIKLASLPVAILLMLAAIMLFWLSPEDRLPGVFRFASWGIPSALVVASGLLWEGAGWTRRMTVMLLLGEASYAIYLFHTFIVRTVLDTFNTTSPMVNTAAVITCASVLGILITLFIEKPLLNFLRKSRRSASV